MEQIRLKKTTDTYFQQAWALYEDAFPLEERRLLELQINVMKKENYHFDVIIDNNSFIGFLMWWDFDTYRYIDHFATSEHLRNKGIGKLILNQFSSITDKPILLEVELPSTTINQRRINFYERIGFKLNLHHYEVPNAIENEPPIQLLLMSCPNYISEQDVIQFVHKYHPIIFND